MCAAAQLNWRSLDIRAVAMSQVGSKGTCDNAASKREFISAFFDNAEGRAAYLFNLHTGGHPAEALTLCLVYIDSFSQWLFWPRSQTGRNFVEALVEHGGDPGLVLVHPLAVSRAFEAMKGHWKDFAMRLRSLLPGPPYSLCAKSDFLMEVATGFTPPEAKLLEDELWRGTIAGVAYTHLRNPSIHCFGGSVEISFNTTTHDGQPASPITFDRLHQALLKLVAEARARSMANNQWFGDDNIVKDV